MYTLEQRTDSSRWNNDLPCALEQRNTFNAGAAMCFTRWNREHIQRAGTTIFHALWNRDTHLTLEQ